MLRTLRSLTFPMIFAPLFYLLFSYSLLFIPRGRWESSLLTRRASYLEMGSAPANRSSTMWDGEANSSSVSGASRSVASGSSTSLAHKRSCRFCRERNIKCDRQQPCANCIRTASDCIYPAEVGRAPKMPRQVLDAQMMSGLSRRSGPQHMVFNNPVRNKSHRGLCNSRIFCVLPSRLWFWKVVTSLAGPH